MASSKVLPRSSATWAFWLSRIQVKRRLPLTSSSTSGQRRRTSVTVNLAPGAGCAGSGSEPSLVSSVSPPAGPRASETGGPSTGSGRIGSGSGPSSGSGRMLGASTGSGRIASGSGASGSGRFDGLRARRCRLRAYRRRLGSWRRRAGHPEPPLQPVEPGVDAAVVDVGAGQQHPGAHQLQVQPRGRRPPHVGQPGRDHLGGPGQLPRPQRGGLGGQAFGLVRRQPRPGRTTARRARRRRPPGHGSGAAGPRRTGAGPGRPRSPCPRR